MTNSEELLEALLNDETVDITPKTRTEAYLKNCCDACGCEGLPTPITRQDALLYELAEKLADGGGGSSSDIDALIDGSITEITSDVGSVSAYVFYYCTALTSANFPQALTIGECAFWYCTALKSVNFPKAETIFKNTFNGCSALTSANIPNAKYINQNAFYGCRNLTSADFPQALTIGSYAFCNCTALKSVNFPKATSIDTNAFRYCEALTSFDVTKITYINSYLFNGCSALITLILRSNTVATLSNENAFTYTPIANGKGYIYVPSALVDTYKAATNWSTYANQFRALEDYTVDGTTTGELDESKINAEVAE